MFCQVLPKVVFLDRKLQKLGLKAQDTAELFFEDVSPLLHPNFFIISSFHRDENLAAQVRVPGSALLGRENAGFYQLMEQLPQVALLVMIIIILFLIGAADDWCPFCGNL